MRHASALATLLLALASFAAACGSSDSGEPAGGGGTDAGATCGFDYKGWAASSQPVSLKTDLMPIFALSCGLSASCHGGEKTSAQAGLYLGPSKTEWEALDPAGRDAVVADVYASLQAKSTEATSLSRVEASHPEKSWLMTKVDDAQKCSGVSCTGAIGCGDSMPQGGALLPDAQRTMIRNWIGQGALNN